MNGRGKKDIKRQEMNEKFCTCKMIFKVLYFYRKKLSVSRKC